MADKELHALMARIVAALKRHRDVTDTSEPGVTCDLCNNAQWWADNGFTPEERQHFCGPQGIACPGF